MNYRISDLLTAVNTALNYPAITFSDIAVYLDMCIGEINTTLHTSLRTVKDCIERSSLERMSVSMVQVLASEPTGESSEVPCIATLAGTEARKWYYWVEKEIHPEWYRKFVFADGNGGVIESSGFATATYVANGVEQIYVAHAYSDGLCIWLKDIGYEDIDLSDYLPEDWILLFVVPYICFKYTVRDGGTASTFAEEMEQGFQQLQETYDVPHAVLLSRFADKPAYRWDVKEALDKNPQSLNFMCVTRAIYENMKHERGVKPVYGSVYDAGGWGV